MSTPFSLKNVGLVCRMVQTGLAILFALTLILMQNPCCSRPNPRNKVKIVRVVIVVTLVSNLFYFIKKKKKKKKK
jgi:hypothetical protein